MASSLQGKPETHRRHVSDEDAVVIPDNARPTDDTPTVISKNQPIVVPLADVHDKFTDMSRKAPTPEAIVANLRGRRLAHYELIEWIGEGGMAAVIRARDTQLDRFVALKILPPEMAKEHENVQRFHQEAKAAAKLDHANIARVFYCGEDQGLYFIAFEFVEGMNLRALMEQRGRLPVAESIGYVLQIAAGLEHAASRGVVHRDVKPSNIIIMPHGQAKLVDMGLARNLERRGERDLTQSGVTLGTFDYISPEQALEPREADSRSDIYSLGCTLYHMLTGLPPVPEGTPAKKLQHHQHHFPVDPRSFNPDIPDDIVKVLGKMMAKDPRDRYQRPIHLVQHLMPIAQTVGAANGLPEGVLLVDTPLPGQRQTRPLLMIGLALAALVVVTLLFSFASGVNTPAGPGPIVYDPKTPVLTQGSEKPPVTPIVNPTKPPLAVVYKPEDLDSVLKSNTPADIKVKLGDSLHLGSSGVVFEGRSDQRFLLEPEYSESRTIRFAYTKQGTPFGITLVSGKEVVFRRIRFIVDSDSTPDRPAAAITVRGVGTVRFEECLFIQNVQKIAPSLVPVASILIEAPQTDGLPRPIVSFEKCYFDGNLQNGGQVAVAINGAATVKVANCAFRPHGAFFSFRDKCSQELTSLEMHNCAGFVDLSPAFRFSAMASAKVDVQNSAFLRPQSEISDRPDVSPGLIYLTAEKSLQFHGRHNLYYNLNSLVQQKDKFLINKADEFQNYLTLNHSSDVQSFYLDKDANPLQHSNPLGRLENLQVFQFNEKYHREKIGLRTSWDGEMPPPPPALMVKAPIRKVINADDQRRQAGEFSTIAAALSDAQDGDTLYIKHGESREVVVRPASIRPGISVMLKPEDGFRPILVLDKGIEKKESTLIEVHKKSKLTLENLEVLLDPEAGYDKRSVVQMGEASHVIFDKCTISLKSTNRVELSVATFLDLNKLMKMENSSLLSAKVEFHECFVRGKGGLVVLQSCRKLEVVMTNSLVALDGSLLDVDASSKAMAMSQGVQWKMDRSSIFSTEPLFALHARAGTVLTETHAKIKDCLLASLSNEQEVVWLDMSREAKLSAYLKWDCDHNFYANFDKDKLREWKEKIPETIMEFGKLNFSPKLGEEGKRPPLWEATADMFKPIEADQERINGFGIPPESEKRLLPTPPPVPDDP